MTDRKQHLQKIFIYHIINYYMRGGGKGLNQFKEEIKEPQTYMKEMNVEINSEMDTKTGFFLVRGVWGGISFHCADVISKYIDKNYLHN